MLVVAIRLPTSLIMVDVLGSSMNKSERVVPDDGRTVESGEGAGRVRNHIGPGVGLGRLGDLTQPPRAIIAEERPFGANENALSYLMITRMVSPRQCLNGKGSSTLLRKGRHVLAALPLWAIHPCFGVTGNGGQGLAAFGRIMRCRCHTNVVMAALRHSTSSSHKPSASYLERTSTLARS